MISVNSSSAECAGYSNKADKGLPDTSGTAYPGSKQMDRKIPSCLILVNSFAEDLSVYTHYLTKKIRGVRSK